MKTANSKLAMPITMHPKVGHIAQPPAKLNQTNHKLSPDPQGYMAQANKAFKGC